MNKLLTLYALIPVLLTGCAYGSRQEAFEACKLWYDKGTQRKCYNEEETRQYLGIQYSNGVQDSKVVKRFKY